MKPLIVVPPCGVSRRVFCAATGLGLLAFKTGCVPGPERVLVGGVDDPPGTQGPLYGPDGSPLATDMGQQQARNPDLTQAQAPPDLAQGKTCPMGMVNGGAASQIAMGSAHHLTDNVNYDLFVMRDPGGLYALSASCTHNGVTVRKQATQFYCPAHGATFDLNGQNPTAPAFSPLDHYAICDDANGNVLVDYNTVVAPSTRG